MNAEGAWDEIQLPKLRWAEFFQVPDGTQIICTIETDRTWSWHAGIPYSAGKATEEDTLWEIQWTLNVHDKALEPLSQFLGQCLLQTQRCPCRLLSPRWGLPYPTAFCGGRQSQWAVSMSKFNIFQGRNIFFYSDMWNLNENWILKLYFIMCW